MLLHIIDSPNGDILGNVNIAGMEEEEILDWLCRKGYLAGGPDLYEITRSYPFAEGEIVVLDIETQKPVLKLELPQEKEAA